MRKSFATGAVILMAAGLVSRLFGFVYRIFLSNLVGAEGIGLYELVVPVYTAVVLTITSGITIAVSKMVAEQKARNNLSNTYKITVCGLVIVMAAGAAVSFFIFVNAGVLSSNVLGDERTYSALIVLVPCLPAVVAAASLKGYFYGIRQVMPTAVSQVLEQAVKLGVLILMVGKAGGRDAEYACAVATLSAALGEIANLIFLLVIFVIKKKSDRGVLPVRKTLRKRRIMAELLKISVPVSANRLIISSLSAIEFVLIPTMLISGGLDSKTSMEVFGRLTGMALPLIMLPSIATNSLATTLVPAISESVALKSYKSLNYQISKSIQATFIIGVIFSALFICYPNEIGELVYRREKIGDLLFMLSFSCIFVYLQQTLNGILNGLGKQGVLLRNTVIGSLLRIASVYFLIPSFGIKSYILGFTVSHLVTEMMNLITVSRMTGLVFNVRDWLLKPCLAGAAMIFAGKYIYGFYRVFFTNNHLITLLASATNIMAAGVFMTATGVMNPDEILKMTGLRKNEKRR